MRTIFAQVLPALILLPMAAFAQSVPLTQDTFVQPGNAGNNVTVPPGRLG